MISSWYEEFDNPHVAQLITSEVDTEVDALLKKVNDIDEKIKPTWLHRIRGKGKSEGKGKSSMGSSLKPNKAG